MVSSFDPGALLSRIYTLPDGLRVRLRLVNPRDESAIRALLAARGEPADDLELAHIVRFDSRRLAICANALIDGTEVIVGVGMIDLDRAQPDLLLVAEGVGADLEELLRAALRGRVQAIARGRAA